MDDEEQTTSLLAPTPETLASVKVFPLIPNLKRDVMKTIDSALTWDQLTASDINFAIVRPLVFKYAKLENMAVVYACFVVRSHFLSEAEENLAYSGVMFSRANLCEIMAMKLLGRLANNQMQLITALTASWSPLAGAPESVMREIRDTIGSEDDDDLHDPQCALEMAIATECKAFLSSPIVQTVVNDIYSGRVVFSMKSHRSVLADNYKPRAIEVYDVHKAPFLDHYRLRVPRYGAILEFLNFGVLMLLFLLCLSSRDLNNMNGFELLFIIFAAAFALEEYTASKEHGWGIYIASIWNVFDTFFVIIFLAYLGLRIKGLSYHDPDASELSFDVLACGACILFPRLAFFAVSNNVVVLALRAMIKDFIFFIGIAAICFSGLLYTLHSLAWETWSVKAIAWLMVQIWFGNTYLSFGQAESFHPVFGPILMTCFAALSNTLLLTILISILSNTFARIDANANQEYLFQFAISTIEGVKSDALFSYQPPFNLFAFMILWPLSFVLSPRALHTTNVFLIKLTSLPTLVVIGIYERYLRQGQKFRESSSDTAHNLYNTFTRTVKSMPILEHIMGTSSTDVYDAIFDIDDSAMEEYDLFEDSDDENRPIPVSRSQPLQPSDLGLGLQRTLSRESSHTRRTSRSPPRRISRPPSVPHTPRQRPVAVSEDSSHATSITPTRRREGVSPSGSPRPRRAPLPSLIQPANSSEIQTVGPRSPLSKLFTGVGRKESLVASQRELERAIAISASADAGIKRVEGIVEELKGLPVNRLKEEMKELQDRQARIENLLLMLTRGMRNDTGNHSTIHHDTM
ncbi:hypothetical protein C8Q75DRAFT_780483 [Abortiporus biennis]|nr:hypothetical protein C8Q75DRAFT_780483 [Abortiporus biennis]